MTLLRASGAAPTTRPLIGQTNVLNRSGCVCIHPNGLVPLDVGRLAWIGPTAPAYTLARASTWFL
jgi:hypothetical protein